MANSEASFRDRQGKSQTLQDFIEGFTPVFTPADASLNQANYQLSVNGADAANTSVETLASNYTTSSTQRVALVKTIRDRTTQALAYIKSNKAWATNYKAVKAAADKFRNMKPPTETAPPTGDGGTPPPAEEKKRNQGQQAFVELEAHFRTFVTAVLSCGGYAPPSTEISAGTLSGFLSQFRGLNDFICTLATQLKTARELRFRLYFAPSGLAEKFQSVKAAVKGQYGQSSTQFDSVKGLKW